MNVVGDRPWFSQYPAGVPHNVDVDAPGTIVSVFERSAAKYAALPAFSCMGKSISYAELDRLTLEFACYLRNSLGLAAGDRVAIMLPNVLQYPIALFGILRAGLIVVNTNPLYTPRELKHQLTDSGATAIVVLENVAVTLQDCLKDTPIKHVVITGVGDQLGLIKGAIVNFVVRHRKKAVPAYALPTAVRFNAALKLGRGQKLPPIMIKNTDIAFLQYTGGTTGLSKGAMLSHRNMIANMQQGSAWVGANFREGNELIITALPLYHIFALTANCMIFMLFGARNHLIPNPRDMAGFVKELSQIRFTALTGVNTLFNGLLNTPGFDQVNFSELRLTLGGGAAVQRAVAERWKKTTGCAVVEGYGLTETAPSCTMNPVNATEFSGSIGVPIPSTDVVIRDDDNNDLPTGKDGELCVKGPQVMMGYWQRPEETAKVMTADGWLRTGDIAKMDERGMFFIVDRKKDMILVSGFNVYPNEIEDVIAQHPGVLEVAAVGVPDANSGEVVKVVIVKKDPALTAEAIKAHCKIELTGYKQPRIIEFRAELPKSNVGKILRRELRDAPK
jgi:long-chain acyl-CoA synthetase